MKKKFASFFLAALAAGLGMMALGAAPGRAGRGGGNNADLDAPAQSLAASKEANLPPEVLLWEKGAPNAKGNSDEDKPAFYPFLPPKDKNTGAAVIVAPGGGFTHRAVDYEGMTWARWFNDHGIAAFVLRYRLRPLYGPADYRLDAQRSVQVVRAHAAEYNISPDRVGMIGFSAGSDLCTMAAFQFLAPKDGAEDVVERQSSKLNFMVLGYGGQKPGADVNPRDVPPTFMFCTLEDKSHATGMIQIFQEFYDNNVPVEIHLFPNGEHGVGMAQGDRVLGEWPNLLHNWMRQNNFLTSEKRASVTGHVLVDGKPLPHGSITFVPAAGSIPGASPLTAFIMNTDTPTADFKLNANVGPIPGKYNIEVRQDGVIWVSNNRDPTRGMSAEDKAAFIRSPGWGIPTMDGHVRLYTKAHPNDKEDLVVEVKPGTNSYNIEIVTK